jgi:NAD(P)-dependent dehydrogenase (short-subunit alcohol dehydrogenase family)
MGFDVQGTTALVTGANRGIGKVIVETLLKHGAAKVYAAVRDVDSARPLADAHGSQVVPLELDLTRPDTIERAAATAADATLVINNAGILRTCEVLDPHAVEALQSELEVNVYGLLRMAQSFAPVLKANGGGAFVQLNSVVSMKCFPDFATYCASKAAAYSLTQALHFALQEQGTQVLSVHPGPIDTDMGREAGLEEMAAPPEQVGESLVSALKSGVLHAFPDPMAQQIGGAYRSFAENIVEVNLMEG